MRHDDLFHLARVSASQMPPPIMKEPEMRTIGGWISQVLAAPGDAALHEKIRAQARELGEQFPVPM